ncbi:hypothetical protein M4951_23645 [Blastopirellula sp. J2-11]|uniref:hypothetical protein n=1 Tax=Blastopirellula sp. J2-11 TaxID=2943192 RepID=UPI0021C69E91|nr:hypothetical protein [Blastopirellula sp. J2-11]UUO06329.1 hypothetical protein M4951_23645 [Blastopirellula sp. J2-11]
MLLFALISVLNLILGFAAAVMLGYGPRPWWILFADAESVGTVRIEKLEDELPTADEANAEPNDTDDEEEESDDSDLDDEDDAEEADDKSARLQEINAEKLAKRLEEEQRRVAAKEAKKSAEKQAPPTKQQVPPPAPAKVEAVEEAALGSDGIIEENDMSSLISEDALESSADDEVESLLRAAEPEAAPLDADESLDEIETLLQAAGQLEAESAAAAPAEDNTEEKADGASVASAEEPQSEPTDRELTAAEIEAMFNN